MARSGPTKAFSMQILTLGWVFRLARITHKKNRVTPQGGLVNIRLAKYFTKKECVFAKISTDLFYFQWMYLL